MIDKNGKIDRLTFRVNDWRSESGGVSELHLWRAQRNTTIPFIYYDGGIELGIGKYRSISAVL